MRRSMAITSTLARRCGCITWGGADWWCWAIEDQGAGCPECACLHQGPEWSWESGRGLYILHQVFDQVEWCQQGQRLHLTKRLAEAHP